MAVISVGCCREERRVTTCDVAIVMCESEEGKREKKKGKMGKKGRNRERGGSFPPLSSTLTELVKLI